MFKKVVEIDKVLGIAVILAMLSACVIRPDSAKTKDGFFKKYEYVYDEYNDAYICPGNQMLKYSTTNRNGYREYKSNGQICMNCPYLNRCTLSKTHQKIITRHI